MKVGDVVWIRERLIDRPQGANDPDDSVYIDWGGIPMFAPPTSVLPDSPTLPAVARWLSDYPQAVADVTRMLVHLRMIGYMDDGDNASLCSLVAALEPAR